MAKIVVDTETPDWFEYPREFVRLVDQGILAFQPWMILRGKRFAETREGLAERFPNRELVPFARRTDCDDVACWERNSGQNVVVIHDFASPGYETRKTYPDFWSWFREAIEEMIEFEP